MPEPIQPAAPPRRGPGRPRRNENVLQPPAPVRPRVRSPGRIADASPIRREEEVDEPEAPARRLRGRPSLNAEADEPESPARRRRGIPRLNSEANEPAAPRRRTRGRSTLNAEANEPAIPPRRGPGRPRRNVNVQEPHSPVRPRRGRRLIPEVSPVRNEEEDNVEVPFGDLLEESDEEVREVNNEIHEYRMEQQVYGR